MEELELDDCSTMDPIGVTSQSHGRSQCVGISEPLCLISQTPNAHNLIATQRLTLFAVSVLTVRPDLGHLNICAMWLWKGRPHIFDQVSGGDVRVIEFSLMAELK